jgi:hypothetical protein
MFDSAELPIEAVVIKAFDNMRTYYSGDEKIICASTDGITPSKKMLSKSNSAPQAKQCAACPQNSWGSRITPNGKRAKACTEYATLQIIALNEPHHALLRVPSTSLRSFRDYEKSLSSRGYSLQGVVTYINLQPKDNFDLFTFKVVRFLQDDELKSIHLSVKTRPRFEKTDGYVH